MRNRMKKKLFFGVVCQIFLLISMSFALAFFVSDNFVSATSLVTPSQTSSNKFVYPTDSNIKINGGFSSKIETGYDSLGFSHEGYYTSDGKYFLDPSDKNIYEETGGVLGDKPVRSEEHTSEPSH